MGKRFGWGIWVIVGVVAAAGAFLFAREQATGGGDAVEPPAQGLPNTPDYHALFVFPEDPKHLLLGTHVGVYESSDGGRAWRFLGLEGKDSMNFARDDEGAIWVAGHNVLERSLDGGRSWEEVRPEGLPGLDIHGFAYGHDDGLFYAAVAGEGLYRSDDGAETFRLISQDVGAGTYGLTVTKDGVVLAAETGRGVLENSAGDGAEWTSLLEMDTVGLTTNEQDRPKRSILAAGESVQLLRDDSNWSEVLSPQEGAGPVAFAPSDPSIAYVVGFDRKLYHSDDGGESWAAVD